MKEKDMGKRENKKDVQTRRELFKNAAYQERAADCCSYGMMIRFLTEE